MLKACRCNASRNRQRIVNRKRIDRPVAVPQSKMQEPQTVVELLTSRVLRLSNTFGLYASRRYREQFGMTLPEWRVMSIIASCEPTTAREISRILATDKGWVGLSVEALRRRGFVTRTSDGRDARRRLVSLTRQGREMHDAILSVARQRQRRLLATLPEGAADTLIASLDRLQAEADRMLDELGASDGPAGSAKPASSSGLALGSCRDAKPPLTRGRVRRANQAPPTGGSAGPRG